MMWMSAVALNEAFGFGEKRFKQFFDAMISVNHWLNENQREGDTEYYPGGLTDPDYCVLRFTAIDGRFYSDYNPRSFTV